MRNAKLFPTQIATPRTFLVPTEEWERQILERATTWTAVIFRGQGLYYERHEFATRAAAEEHARNNPAASGKRWMVYGVNPEGRFALVTVV